ncbi:MAG: pyruvate dehydrogenase (acetyl-transferring) E1 component subunit alpha, partial [Actinobacteria bacterium HGW-Actinobacteria-5]
MTVVSDKEQAKGVLRDMWRIRLFEEAVEDLYGRGMMHGTMHLSIGQEAVPVGANRHLVDGD